MREPAGTHRRRRLSLHSLEVRLRLARLRRVERRSTWDRYDFNPVIEITGDRGYFWMSGVKVDGTFTLYWAIQAGKHGIGAIRGMID